MLIHQPATEGVYGQVSDLEIQANEIQRVRRLLETTLARHTNKDADEVRRDIERDKILTAEEAKSLRHRRRGPALPQALDASPEPTVARDTPRCAGFPLARRARGICARLCRCRTYGTAVDGSRSGQSDGYRQGQRASPA